MDLLNPMAAPWLIAGLFALCFGGLSWVLLQALQEGMQAYQSAYEADTARHLSDMFLFIPPRRILDIARLSALIAFVVIFLLVGDVTRPGGLLAGVGAGLVAALVALQAPRTILRLLKERRLARFNDQLVDALSSMSNALKAGFSIVQAIETVVKQGRNPIAQEFGVFLQQIRVGVRFEEALAQLGDRVPSEDLSLMISAIEIARRTGGNLTEVFDKIAATIRERARLEGKIRSLTAMGRLQGWVVGAMPLALLVVLSLLDPVMIRQFVTSLPGVIILGLVVLLELAGAWFIRRIIRIEI